MPSYSSKYIYANPDVTKRDYTRAVEQYKHLTPSFGRFTFNDGRTKELLKLEGTVPIKYKGSSYNIPICIWLMDTHPNVPPICFVVPTPDMRIKISHHVDHSGRIYLPYLHDWNPAVSDILGLIHVMVCVFGECPPVFSKLRTDPVQTPYPTRMPSYMPMPGTSVVSPYPPMVPQMGQVNPVTPYPTPAYPPMNTTPYPMYPLAQPTPASQSGNSGTITEEHIKASLLSAVQDKLKLKLNEEYAQCKAEYDILKQTSEELNNGKSKLTDLLDKLSKEKVDIERNITILKDREAELQKAITELDEQGDIDVDEAVTTTAPLYKQILNAYAEEAALEDTIYYMGEGLRRGVIDLDVFLKQVRSLSRKQFMLRALMQKCRQKAGLIG
ncbi:unnamed protein product [Nesidiocoris tenuis]|uniref:UEV domain-containing protein n=1 Tax=Nesidiocoris tenuis TaxID=355587 RepID=A0A6H5G3F7_9HEMI|nr:unnamed protein product [Nesidiocoris tenuis]